MRIVPPVVAPLASHPIDSTALILTDPDGNDIDLKGGSDRTPKA